MWITGKNEQIPEKGSGKKVLEEHSVFQIVTWHALLGKQVPFLDCRIPSGKNWNINLF
jgi:hypothetical protein